MESRVYEEVDHQKLMIRRNDVLLLHSKRQSNIATKR
jgi:hypothetical protein